MRSRVVMLTHMFVAPKAHHTLFLVVVSSEINASSLSGTVHGDFWRTASHLSCHRFLEESFNYKAGQTSTESTIYRRI